MDYIEELKKRKKESRVYKEYQLVGLLIAEILEDEEFRGTGYFILSHQLLECPYLVLLVLYPFPCIERELEG